jgi:hypothetical protein
MCQEERTDGAEPILDVKNAETLACRPEDGPIRLPPKIRADSDHVADLTGGVESTGFDPHGPVFGPSFASDNRHSRG